MARPMQVLESKHRDTLVPLGTEEGRGGEGRGEGEEREGEERGRGEGEEREGEERGRGRGKREGGGDETGVKTPVKL